MIWIKVAATDDEWSGKEGEALKAAAVEFYESLKASHFPVSVLRLDYERLADFPDEQGITRTTPLSER